MVSGGANIYPREIEEVLLKHSRVLEAAVVGAPHPTLAEQVTAFVTLKPLDDGSEEPPPAVLSGSTWANKGQRGLVALDEALVGELDRLCLDHVARFKRPRQYFVLAELPKSAYGKVLKTSLRGYFSQ